MDFARKQLEKYGWSDGKGLGKNENGISQALKPKLKRSMTGIGHDAAADFTEHWWSALYDKAASNIEVKEKDGTTKNIIAKSDTSFEITNSTWKLNKKFKPSVLKAEEQYKDFFVKTVVLSSGGTSVQRVKESDSDQDDVEKDVLKLTDEELFAACGGRTAHKGARHGLKALGKLARIEKQEQLLLQQERFNGYSHGKEYIMNKCSKEEIFEDISLSCEKMTETKRKKKKKQHCLKQENYEMPRQEMNINYDNTFIVETKKKKSIKCASNKKEKAYNTAKTVEPRDLKRKLLNDTIIVNDEVISKKQSKIKVATSNTNTKNLKKKKKVVLNAEECVKQNEIISDWVPHKKTKNKS